MKVSSDVFLPASVEEAWAALLRWEDQPSWMKDADTVRVVTAQREGVGARIGVKTRVLGIPLFTEQLEVTLWEPPRRLVMAHRSFVRGVGTWTLAPIDDGTWFTWTEELSLPVPLLGELALRAYGPFMRRLMRGALENLSAYVGGST